MPSRDIIQADHDYMSGKVSELTRTISISVLALVWLFIAGGKEAPSLPSAPNQPFLLAAGSLVLLSLLSDYLQYVAGYLNSKELLDVADEVGTDSLKYNDKALLYRARKKLFVVKQVFALAALLSLFVAVGSAFCRAA